MKNPWDKIQTPDIELMTIRADALHPLDFFWAKDHLNRYLFVYEYPSKSDLVIHNPPDLEGINTENIINENVARLIFTLKDKENWEMFCDLCKNLMKATNKATNPEKAPSLILNRLKRWQRFLKKSKLDILREEQIKGLIGELLFLKNWVIPQFGVTDGVKFWLGPEGSPQDFAINNLCIEVKCQLGSTKPTIRISSIDQLYTQSPNLVLYVITLGKSTIETTDSINLPGLIDEIELMIDREESPSLNRFQELLIEIGYVFKEKYNEFNYLFLGERAFNVKGDFPRILPSDVKEGVERLTYNININECVEHEIDIDHWSLNDY
ncbi:MAG: PD-(D/E)XK motif protein [Candidatus Marinimicrobia bacterium]|jgi:hypothetical protein|nr:PD-(D/E)XK motif protein [Candidatus Neomarinimicrobiota bacterium]